MGSIFKKKLVAGKETSISVSRVLTDVLYYSLSTNHSCKIFSILIPVYFCLNIAPIGLVSCRSVWSSYLSFLEYLS